MLIVKDNMAGSVFEIRPWKEGDTEKTGVAFGNFGYKFVCSYVSGRMMVGDLDLAKDLAGCISIWYLLCDIEFGYDPHPPYRFERKLADVLRMKKYRGDKDWFEVEVKQPVDHSNYRPDVIY